MGNELGCVKEEIDDHLKEDSEQLASRFTEPELAILKETFKKVGDSQGKSWPE